MSDLSVEITGFVEGDDLEIRRAVTELPAAIAVAWLTVKRHHNQPDDEAKLQKRITVADVPGTPRRPPKLLHLWPPQNPPPSAELNAA